MTNRWAEAGRCPRCAHIQHNNQRQCPLCYCTHTTPPPAPPRTSTMTRHTHPTLNRLGNWLWTKVLIVSALSSPILINDTRDQGWQHWFALLTGVVSIEWAIRRVALQVIHEQRRAQLKRIASFIRVDAKPTNDE